MKKLVEAWVIVLVAALIGYALEDKNSAEYYIAPFATCICWWIVYYLGKKCGK